MVELVHLVRAISVGSNVLIYKINLFIILLNVPDRVLILWVWVLHSNVK